MHFLRKPTSHELCSAVTSSMVSQRQRLRPAPSSPSGKLSRVIVGAGRIALTDLALGFVRPASFECAFLFFLDFRAFAMALGLVQFCKRVMAEDPLDKSSRSSDSFSALMLLRPEGRTRSSSLRQSSQPSRSSSERSEDELRPPTTFNVFFHFFVAPCLVRLDVECFNVRINKSLKICVESQLKCLCMGVLCRYDG